MKVWKVLLIIAAIPILYIGGMILFGTLTDHRPAPVMQVAPAGHTEDELARDTVILYSWNIGYAGLGSESDFFMDGGTSTRVSGELSDKNLSGIRNAVASWQDADLFLFQEVDEKARRSYGVNQYSALEATLGGHWMSAMAYNYVVRFVPVPFFDPLGNVRGGLATFSKYKVDGVTRHQFPGNYSWPKRVFFLDRCFLVMRIPYGNRELVVVNTHNSAYDDGTLKKAEMEHLGVFLLDEYAKGNYVIVGGDWNQCPPGYRQDRSEHYRQSVVPEDFPGTGWQWAYDGGVPTNRKLAAPYEKGSTYTTVIDFFLVSPNVLVESAEGVDLDFSFSDHQPVRLKARFLP